MTTIFTKISLKYLRQKVPTISSAFSKAWKLTSPSPLLFKIKKSKKFFSKNSSCAKSIKDNILWSKIALPAHSLFFTKVNSLWKSMELQRDVYSQERDLGSLHFFIQLLAQLPSKQLNPHTSGLSTEKLLEVQFLPWSPKITKKTDLSLKRTSFSSISPVTKKTNLPTLLSIKDSIKVMRYVKKENLLPQCIF